MPAIALAQVRFRRTNLLPQDEVVNTFHFAVPTEAVTVAQAAEIQASLTTFFNTAAAPSTNPIALHLSSALDTTGHRIKVYDLSEPEPRAPIRDEAFTLGPHAGQPLPSEVAVCLSYEGAQTSGQPQRRRRGRIFLGPLATSATTTLDTGDARPHATFRNIAVDSAWRLASLALPEATEWVVFSPTGLTAANVVKVWADNAFDIQRRRGVQPTSRIERTS